MASTPPSLLTTAHSVLSIWTSNNAGQGIADVALGALAFEKILEKDGGQDLGMSGGEA